MNFRTNVNRTSCVGSRGTAEAFAGLRSEYANPPLSSERHLTKVWWDTILHFACARSAFSYRSPYAEFNRINFSRRKGMSEAYHVFAIACASKLKEERAYTARMWG